MNKEEHCQQQHAATINRKPSSASCCPVDLAVELRSAEVSAEHLALPGCKLVRNFGQFCSGVMVHDGYCQISECQVVKCLMKTCDKSCLNMLSSKSEYSECQHEVQPSCAKHGCCSAQQNFDITLVHVVESRFHVEPGYTRR